MAHITLQLVGLLGMLDVELLRVTGVVVELVAVGEVTSLSLIPFCLQELGLVGMDFVVGPFLPGLALVLQVALELAGCQRVHHLGVVLHTAQPHLLALLLQMGLLVAELQQGEGDLIRPQPKTHKQNFLGINSQSLLCCNNKEDCEHKICISKILEEQLKGLKTDLNINSHRWLFPWRPWLSGRE